MEVLKTKVKCAMCGKVVYRLSFVDYAWKIGKPARYFCSYTCLRKYEKKIIQGE